MAQNITDQKVCWQICQINKCISKTYVKSCQNSTQCNFILCRIWVWDWSVSTCAAFSRLTAEALQVLPEKKIKNIYTIFKSCVFQQQPPCFGYHSGWHESKMVTARKHLRAGFMKEKEKNKECSNKSCRRGKRDYRWESSSCSSRNGRYNNNSSTGQLFTPTRVISKTVILLWNIMAGLCCSHVVHVTFFSIALK